MPGNCVIRVDSGQWIGVGHVSRCLTLAEALRWRGMAVHFVCRKHPGAALDWIEDAGFMMHRLPVLSAESVPASYEGWLGDDWRRDAMQTAQIIRDSVGVADWLVVDHYGISEKWESVIRQVAHRIFVIDDLADRKHDCDLLLDQNLREGNPYRGLLPPTTKVLIGPRYALLRDEFRQARASVATRSGEIRRIVVFFGGSDPTDETTKAVEALRILNLPNIEVDVIVGKSNLKKDKVAELCAALPYMHFHCQVTDMANFLAQADLALGAAGVSSWERLALGVSALVVAVADNQMENMRQLEKQDVALGLGTSSQVSVRDMVQAIGKMLASPDTVRAMSEKAFELVDGEGARRVVQRMEVVG